MNSLIVSSVLFVLSHMVLSAYPVRRRLVNHMGIWPFLGVYCLIAGTVFWAMLNAYLDSPYELIWQPPIAFRHLAISVMLLCCIFLVSGYTSANAAAVGADKTVALMDQPKGIFRVTRHPVMWAVGLWATTHFVANGTWAAMWFFGTLAFLAFAGAVHMDHRKLRERGTDWQDYLNRTSSVPFLAIGQGRQQFLLGEIGVWRLAISVLLYGGLLLIHESFTGASPLPL
ncbi:MAG: hypothetical protein HN644_02175 [Rhodospirillales bacterium]|jgi:uncharacterized membrane protein|nr:hypothetical protein [Rhodospirillales bacterium]MBT4038621.1 hypothetical protein [Rhodospirillales bacterium]MBT4627619.1 hypothetical protein [Rhodospirillales bacterium]MBT5351538.1 hypothetical protein [Rhodospirillales bacterium]MBT5521512.1 hypothetical protein [Rhodospirillales bacterium]